MQLGTCCHDFKSKQVGDPFAQFKPYSDVKQAMQVVVHTYFKQRKENETSQMLKHIKYHKIIKHGIPKFLRFRLKQPVQKSCPRLETTPLVARCRIRWWGSMA
jgi:hypothetical protein